MREPVGMGASRSNGLADAQQSPRTTVPALYPTLVTHGSNIPS